MRFPRVSLILAVAMATLSIGLAGCGSSKHSTAKKAAAAAHYKVGEFCSPKNASAYKKAGLTCAKEKNSYRLQKV